MTSKFGMKKRNTEVGFPIQDYQVPGLSGRTSQTFGNCVICDASIHHYIVASENAFGKCQPRRL